jgi:hypothetical protein
MSHYKHIYNAVSNTMHHLKQAQEMCEDAMSMDKEACGTWKKELKQIERQINACYKKVESKHKKASTKKEPAPTIEKKASTSTKSRLKKMAGWIKLPTGEYKEIDDNQPGTINYKERAEQRKEEENIVCPHCGTVSLPEHENCELCNGISDDRINENYMGKKKTNPFEYGKTKKASTFNRSANIYKDNGYENRKDYLQSLSEEYGVDIKTVHALASMLGPDEDFDGLVSAIEDLEDYYL